MKVLVTGNAGFIGFHVARALLQRGDSVVGFDSVNDYYDPALKEARLATLDTVAAQSAGSYHFVRNNLADAEAVDACFAEHAFDRVIHLAAQAGVRYSMEAPLAYIESNVTAFCVLLEACRRQRVAHLTYASTSSVYGANTQMPYREDQGVNHPLQLYAATKRANELMAHSYSHLYRIPTTGLRFFTVYGPWGRPDMALFKFTRNIQAGQPIQVYNHGHHSRDFTYIDDIVEGVIRASDQIASAAPDWNSDAPDPASSDAPYRVFNIGNQAPTSLGDYITAIEEALGKAAIRELLPLQPGDAADTFADSSALAQAVGYTPSTPVRQGVRAFVDWYLDRYVDRYAESPTEPSQSPFANQVHSASAASRG
ncbi:UDP-glucuronate 4-epimerase [Onishia taeanensis]|uniref:UDP-glucuronate 4-epimerase n=1 Tax=Onishia taeanensis TaxID=284577 RepID=A0A1G7TE95_9GAMM|nr:NAD-dependent epimerase [Halomonas taeanensis]SDG33638.1 UDP-glucuronate 4-epimerase [Halomonas taeanensis]